MSISLHTLAALALLLGTATASLAQNPSLNWGSEINPARCPTDQGYRYLEINVTRKVEEDIAPGAGHFDADPPVPFDGWALREFNQHIQVWKIGVVEPPGGDTVGAERYCALVRYQGSFLSTGTSNPNGSGEGLAAGVDGTFEGGYRLVFNADENFVAPTRGHVETVAVSSSATDWLQYYFVKIGVKVSGGDVAGIPTPAWWGWVYHGGHNGTWVNVIGGGVQGNITGAP